MKYDMVIFDIDGTIWDVLDKTEKAYKEVLSNRKIDNVITSGMIRKCLGMNMKEVGDNLLSFIPDENERIEIVKEADRIRNRIIEEEGAETYPDFRKVFLDISYKYKTAIVSNCGPDTIETLIKVLNLNSYITDFIAASRFQITKSEAIRRVAERNNAENYIYIGDTEGDKISSAEAGAEFIQVTYGFGEDLNERYHIDKLIELPDLIEEMEFRNSGIIH